MTGMVDWATDRARMIFIFVVLSIAAGTSAYFGLPKEGEPDIDVPVLFVSVPFPGISAEDAEKLIVKPLEAELQGMDGLKEMTATAAEGFASIALEFEFGWDKSATIADVRANVDAAEADFPDGTEQYTIDELNFSLFPILVISLSGDVPERALARVAKDLQDQLEGLPAILEAGLAGQRDEMVEVIIDPLKLEAYNVTADELVDVVVNNNQLIAAGEVRYGSGTFAAKIRSSFDDLSDIYGLPIKVNGDRVVTLGQLADIRLTFEDAEGTARFNGEKTIALQVVKRKGFNHIDTANEVRAVVASAQALWPEELRNAVTVDFGLDQSAQVQSMIQQLEGSVLTAILLVMIVVLAALGMRSALLVGFAIPTSFLISFALMAVAGITISNIVMFGLILAVGMLVDGAIVVVEYADKRIREGMGPMRAYGAAAKRMFWPIISSTATTLCAFLPMLFWPGVPGEFMGNLPVTMIFVLSASLVVALIYLPVVGGIAGRVTRWQENLALNLREKVSFVWRAVLWVVLVAWSVQASLGLMSFLFDVDAVAGFGRSMGTLFQILYVSSILIALAMVTSTFRKPRPLVEDEIDTGPKETFAGRFARFLVGNPVMPFVTIFAVIFFVMFSFVFYGQNNYGSEFFVDTEPENLIVYVRGRGNMSLDEKDALVREIELRALQVDGIKSAFAFAGDGGLNNNTGGSEAPIDTIGQVQIELESWEIRGANTGDGILREIESAIQGVPGIEAEILEVSEGPAQGKPLFIRLTGPELTSLEESALMVRRQLERTPGLTLFEDSTPLPGIDWQIDVDVEQAGRYGADVATVGAMVQLVTRGILLGTMRFETSDDEVEIRVRLPEADRRLGTLDSLKVRTEEGLVPLSNFVTREPVPELAQIQRVDTNRFYDVKADIRPNLFKVVSVDTEEPIAFIQQVVDPNTQTTNFEIDDVPYSITELISGSVDEIPSLVGGGQADLQIVNAGERIAAVTEWLENEAVFPAGIEWRWEGDQEDEAESAAFLSVAFSGALALMFVILLAQFNSFYNAVLVLLAVVMSVAGVLWGMVIREQAFSVIMTGTGIVALAGIVVNNNIVLIDTYQEYARIMPRIQAIIRTVRDRIRPVLLTTITTMAGLTPMMFGVSIDFGAGGYTVDAPTALWWKQLATAVVWGLGVATALTLVFTPSALAARVYVAEFFGWSIRSSRASWFGHRSQAYADYRQSKAANETRPGIIDWTEDSSKVADLPAQAAE
ncbi:MAG: efflux RND transporter permease subunit [Pseudomonadota bacterium]